jgi:hypothetical protein
MADITAPDRNEHHAEIARFFESLLNLGTIDMTQVPTPLVPDNTS